MEDLISDWNSNLAEREKMVKDHNEEVSKRFKAGEIAAETAMSLLEPVPKKVKAPTEAWLRKWKQAYGWSMITRSGDDLQWLPFDHVDMQQSREETLKLLSHHAVHKYCILNYDQIWRSCYGLTKHKLNYKNREYAGHRTSKAKFGQRQDKKLNHVRGSRRSMTVPWQ